MLPRCVFAIILVAQLAGCGESNTDASPVMDVVLFEEQEPVTEPYSVRMLVTAEFLRIDDGEGSEDFVLFDRKSKNIYSINSEDLNILEIPYTTHQYQPSVELKHRQTSVSQNDAPKVNGQTPMQVSFYTNDQLCVEVIAVKGLLPTVLSALKEYHQALSAEQAKLASRTPDDLVNDCDLAENVVLPTRHLEYGFPIQLAVTGGRQRKLTAIDQAIAVDRTLFEIPQGFERFSPPQ